MSIDDLTVGQARQLAAMFAGQVNAQPAAPHPFTGKYCICRCTGAGVHAGEVVSVDGDTSSQLVRWAAERADAYREEVAVCIPDEPLDLLALRSARQEDAGPIADQQPEPDAGPEPEPDASPVDPDHNATGETMDDFLNGLDGAGGEE